LPRIKPDDAGFGKDYTERAKLVGRYFRQEFETLRKEIEQPKYFREKLIYNYIYKGPFLEWYMRIKTRLEKNYQVFHDLVPLQGKILDIGCGYGFMSYMLSFTSAQRNITGIDYDEDKIDTANNCFSKTDMVNFVHSDIMGFEFEQYDAIILADMLHYLQPTEQKLVIEKCISNLNTCGMVIIRDGDADKETQHEKTKLTEYFSTRLFKFNKTKNTGLHFLSGRMIREIAVANNLACSEVPDSKLTSNTIFILKNSLEV
jgi:2-polyprenyl-3-methyl-5-hydroxy-6-metoxy-1,4-benzoquinol methylase